MNNEMKEYIETIAKKSCLADDEDIDVYGLCGNNIDDTYSAGQDTGEIMFARLLLEKFG